MDIVKFDEIEGKILELRGQKVILDSDVAELYGVETRDINKAVKNNPDKFPDGYIFELNKAEFEDLRWKISTAKFSKTRVLPKAFTALLNELRDECLSCIKLIHQLDLEHLTDDQIDDVLGELSASVTHLQIHSAIVKEEIEKE